MRLLMLVTAGDTAGDVKQRIAKGEDNVPKKFSI
jgi:hypothetical protein